MFSRFTRRQKGDIEESRLGADREGELSGFSTEMAKSADDLQLTNMHADTISDRGKSPNAEVEQPSFEDLALSECSICLEDKLLAEFPQRRTTSTCAHFPTACIECIQSSLLAQFEENTMEHISCPECPERLAPNDAQVFLPMAKYRKQVMPAVTSSTLYGISSGIGRIKTDILADTPSTQ